MKTALLITSIARPDLLTQCILSWLPVLSEDKWVILIAEQGACTEASHSKLIAWGGTWEHYVLPYDCGLSASRNYLLGKALKHGCERCLLAADSIHGVGFSESTADVLGGMLTATRPLIGGRIAGREDFTAGLGLDKDGFFLYKYPERIISREYRVKECGICCNFFIALTEVLANVRWDSDLKTNEHEDFFWRLGQAGYVCGYCADMLASYVRCTTEEYARLRSRVGGAGAAALCRKYKIKQWLRRVQ